VTDTTGHSFISYRRTRLDEVRLLIEAMHDVGIPTWQDLNNLAEGHTEELLREVLAAETTSNAVCWLTPDVEQSNVITRTELPCIMKRIDRRDGFFMTPIAAGGLGYESVRKIVGTYSGTHDLGKWNIRKVTGDPISIQDAADVAAKVLRRRIQEMSNRLPSGQPLRLVLNSRKKPAFEPGVALSLDWTYRFDGRMAKPAAWNDFLVPALETVAQMIEQYAAGRAIVAEGLCALPAAVALGVTFLTTRRVPISWHQVCPNRPAEIWSLSETPENSGFAAHSHADDSSANDVALLVSVASNVEPAFAASRQGLPPFRCIVSVTKPGQYPHDIKTPAEAVDIIQIIGRALREARDTFQPRGKIHLFLAVPAGLAMMLGQTLNTFGPIQTYEHIATDAVGMYRPSVFLSPSG
jgi:hypothetical protein